MSTLRNRLGTWVSDGNPNTAIPAGDARPAGGAVCVNTDDGTLWKNLGTPEAPSWSVQSGGSADLSAIAEDVLPATDDTYDLGSQAKRWADVFVNGGIYADDTNPLIKLLPFTSGEVDYVAFQLGQATGRIVIDPLYNGQPFSFGAIAVLDGQTVAEYDPNTVFDGKRANLDFDQLLIATERATVGNQTPTFGVPVFAARAYYWESDAAAFADFGITHSVNVSGHVTSTAFRRSGDLDAVLFNFDYGDAVSLATFFGGLALPGLPTTDPGVGRKLWIDSGVLKITAAS